MKIEKLVLIAQNSALHLESVIEDALDISRLENNKFTLFYDSFDIRAVCNEVADIMKF
jgi:signal transduction histidine kinase